MKTPAVMSAVSRVRLWLGAGLLSLVLVPPAWSAAKCGCGCGNTPRPACAHSCGGTPCTGAASPEEAQKLLAQSIGQTVAAAPKCNCGCGGSPKPYCAHRCNGTPCTSASLGPEGLPVAATCSCGCGGTPRPACAHSCKGNPCTGGTLQFSRLVVGQVVEGKPATLSVLAPNGNALTGFVVEFDDGQKVTTDDNGMATFVPSSAKKKLTAKIAGLATTGITVLDAKQAAVLKKAIPRYIQRGVPLAITIPGNFDGDSANTKVTLGGQPCGVLAESPVQAVVNIPTNAPAGTQTLRIVDVGQPVEAQVTCYNLGMSADKLDLMKGESTNGRLTITPAPPADSGGAIRIQNLSPATIRLSVTGGQTAGPVSTIPVSAARIREGVLEVPFVVHATKGGTFTITGTLSDPGTQGAAKCSCGCNGTPRPACAHSCGGNPCTGS